MDLRYKLLGFSFKHSVLSYPCKLYLGVRSIITTSKDRRPDGIIVNLWWPDGLLHGCLSGQRAQPNLTLTAQLQRQSGKKNNKSFFFVYAFWERKKDFGKIYDGIIWKIVLSIPFSNKFHEEKMFKFSLWIFSLLLRKTR